MQTTFERLEARLVLSALPFIGGDIVVYRIGVGNGSTALSSSGNPVFLDEYSPTGTLVQSIELPITADTGTPNPIINSGSGQANGELDLSANGQYLTFTGYDAALPNGSGQSLKSSAFLRDVGEINIDGNLDTSTVPSDYSIVPAKSTPSTAISVDGTGFWLTSQTGGLRYAPLGDTGGSTQVNTGDNTASLNQMQIYNGQLYVTDRSKIYQVGTGLPTSGGYSLTPLSGISVNFPSGDGFNDFFLTTLDVADHGSQPDTIYFSDPGHNQIDKYSATFSGGVPVSWTLTGTIAEANASGLTGYTNGNTVVMYSTAGSTAGAGGGSSSGGGALYTFTDVSGYDAAPVNATGGTTATTLVTLPATGEGFRGVAIVPNQSPTLNHSGTSSLPNLLENPSSNAGELVSAVISALGATPITDTSASQHQGIAITQADQTNGTWQYSLNAGSTWQNFPTMSTTTALLLASDGVTKVRFVPNNDFNGTANFTFSAWDQSQGFNGQTFDVAQVMAPAGSSPFSTATATASQTVTFVNQAPSFVRGASQSVLNTVSAQTVANWATNISPGAANESGQTLNFIVSNDNNSLFLVQPSISANGTLTYTPAPGGDGVANVTVQLHDNGGTANGGMNTSAAQFFQIAVTPVGDSQPPVNLIPFAPQTTLENQPLTFSSANDNSISVSDPNAGSNPIQVTLTISGGTATLSGLAGLTGSGNGTSSLTYQGTVPNLNAALAGLVYTPTSDINGLAAGQITMATDNLGNTGNGPPKTSTDSITINITPVNQAPSFTPGGNITTPASGTYSQQWASNISAGPPNESGQSVAFSVSNNNPAAFLVQPSLSPTGLLTFTPVPGPAHTVTVTVQLQDSGGTANGGVDVSPMQTFLIQLTAVNLPPAVAIPGTQRLIVNTPLVFASGQFNTSSQNEYNGITVSDPDGFSTTEQVQLTAADGTLTLPANAISGVSITAGANNSSAVTFTGTLALLNKALDGLSFTPTTGFTGTAAVTVVINDLNTTTPPFNLSATGTINIDVVTAPPLVISEVLANPPGLDDPNQYIEIRSATPDYTIPSGTYFISLNGSPQSITVGSTVTTYQAGTVFDVFNLSGDTTGSNDYLVILENGNTYNNYPDYGGLDLIDQGATVLDNGINPDGSVAIGTGAGFGNNFVAPGSSIVGHSALFRPNDTDLLKPSATYLLINSPGAVTPGDDVDPPTVTGGPPTGTLHGAEFNSWTVWDAVGATSPSVGTPGDVSYGYINYVDSTGTTNYATPNSTTVTESFSADYVARANNNSGWAATDWVASSGLGGTAPTWTTGSSSHTVPSADANRPLNNIGGPNFDTSQPAVVTTAQATINYPVGSGPVVVDPTVTVTDPDSSFLASAQVSIATNYNPATDSLQYSGSSLITGSFNSTTGILTLTGADTFADWDAALESVTFTYTGSVVSNPPTRKIVFEANDGLVLSNPTNSFDTINIVGPVVSPPIVSGTSPTPVTWTQALLPNSPPAVTIAPNLTITDGSTSQLTSATVSISANFSSGEDLLGWNAATAAANDITVTSSPHSHFLTLAPTSPDISEPLANYQAVLRTVTYSDTSDNPNTAPRTVTFTVIDGNSIISSINANSQQVINLVAVHNPPLVTTSSGENSYTAGSAPILVDGAVTLTAPDSPTLSSATVSISGGFASGDTLGFVNQAGIGGSYNSANGVLTLTGTGTPLDYQIALRAITFSTSAATAAGTRTISFTVNDGLGNSNLATKSIAVQAFLLGDINGDGHVNAADILPFMRALTNLQAYQTSRGLTAAQLLAVADINHDGKVTTADLQALLNLLKGGGGSGSGSLSNDAVTQIQPATVSIPPETQSPASAVTTVLPEDGKDPSIASASLLPDTMLSAAAGGTSSSSPSTASVQELVTEIPTVLPVPNIDALSTNSSTATGLVDPGGLPLVGTTTTNSGEPGQQSAPARAELIATGSLGSLSDLGGSIRFTIPTNAMLSSSPAINPAAMSDEVFSDAMALHSLGTPLLSELPTEGLSSAQLNSAQVDQVVNDDASRGAMAGLTVSAGSSAQEPSFDVLEMLFSTWI